ncbi:MAG: hypothetical protein AAF799_09850 [Myxococcota bacterium]
MGACGGSSGLRRARGTGMAASRRRPGRGAACRNPGPTDGPFVDDLELHEPLAPGPRDGDETPEQRRQRIRKEVEDRAAEAEPPSAGFEIEFADAQIVRLDGTPTGPTGNLLKRLNDSNSRAALRPAWARTLQAENNLRRRRKAAFDILGKELRNPADHIAYTKRDVCLRARNGTWNATTDTVGDFDSRLEIVTLPLTREQWGQEHVREDLRVLDQLATAVGNAARGELIPLREIVEGLDVDLHEPDAWVIVHPRLEFQFQMTRQIPLTALHSRVPEAAHGLTGVELAQLKSTISTFADSHRGSNNPKEAFADLPKSPLHAMIDFPHLTDAGEIEAWVQGVAKAAGIKDRLDEDPIKAMRDRTAGKFRPQLAGFDWHDFLTALVTGGGDRLAYWSKSAFAGEDFGYGTLGRATLLPGYGLFEKRRPKPEGRTLEQRIDSLLDKWRRELPA